jgi:hypothetical protein
VSEYDGAEESEHLSEGRHYAPVFVPANGNGYTKLILTWAGLSTLLVVSMLGWWLATKSSRDDGQTDAISALAERLGRLEEWKDTAQRELERLRK